MNKLIVFPNDNGGVVFCYLASDCGLSIEQIAAKDVPTGKPYMLVDDADVPKDHLFFGAFEVDFSNPDGYGA